MSCPYLEAVNMRQYCVFLRAKLECAIPTLLVYLIIFSTQICLILECVCGLHIFGTNSGVESYKTYSLLLYIYRCVTYSEVLTI